MGRTLVLKVQGVNLTFRLKFSGLVNWFSAGKCRTFILRKAARKNMIDVMIKPTKIPWHKSQQLK